MYSSVLHSELPRWGVMWAIALAVYGLLKIATWTNRANTDAPAWKHVGYLMAWPGMDVDAFLNRRPTSRPDAAEWSFAVLKALAGAGLVFIAGSMLEQYDPLATGWTAMLGIVLALHFGLFHVLSCAWRSAGVQATPIMNWPIAAYTLAEFWSRRWNLAFRDVTKRFIFRPLAARLGPPMALFGSFVVSGLIHDLVISVPAAGGYGLPTLYLTLQGAAILLERSRIGAALHWEHELGRRLYSLAVLVLHCPLLFHALFVERVIVPMLQSLKGPL